MLKRVGIIYGVVLVAALVLFLATMFPITAAVVTVLAALYFLPRLKRKPLKISSSGDDFDYLAAARGSDTEGLKYGYFRNFHG